VRQGREVKLRCWLVVDAKTGGWRMEEMGGWEMGGWRMGGVYRTMDDGMSDNERTPLDWSARHDSLLRINLRRSDYREGDWSTSS
jgi:hypothetical protein